MSNTFTHFFELIIDTNFFNLEPFFFLFNKTNDTTVWSFPRSDVHEEFVCFKNWLQNDLVERHVNMLAGFIL